MPQIRTIQQERIRFEPYENVRTFLSEGQFTSVLGKLTLDSSGNVILTSILGVLSGGISEAKKLMKSAMKIEKESATLFFFFGTFFLSVASQLALKFYQLNKRARM